VRTIVAIVRDRTNAVDRGRLAAAAVAAYRR